MGAYIKLDQASGKAETLCSEHGAVQITRQEAKELARDQEAGVIVIANNGLWEAAMFAHTWEEFDRTEYAIKHGDCRAPYTYLRMDRAKAKEMCDSP